MGEPSPLGRYRSPALIARDDAGEVYRARDTVHDQDVAVRLLPIPWAADAHFRRRFHRDMGLAAWIRHPRIVPVLDFGEQDGALFVVTPLIDAPDLATLLDRFGPLGPAGAVSLVEQLADGLAAVRAAGLTHGTLTPSWVLVAGPAGSEGGYLSGVGLWPGDDGGTAGADVRALGWLLRRSMAGTVPGRRTAAAIPAEVDRVAATAITSGPDAGFRSAGDLAAAARHALASSVRTAAARRRQRLLVGALAAFLLLVLVGAGVVVGVTRSTGPSKVALTAVGSIPVGDIPGSVALTPDASTLLVSSTGDKAVRRIDTESGAGTDLPLASGQLPRDVVIDPAGRLAYVAGTTYPGGRSTDVIDVVNLASGVVVDSATVRGIGAADLSQDGSQLYLACGIDGVLEVLGTDALAPIATVAIGGVPIDVALTPDGTRAVVAVYSGAVAVVDVATTTVLARIPLGTGPSAVAITPDGRRALVTTSGAFVADGERNNDGSSALTVIDLDTRTVGPSVRLGREPVAVAVDGERAYVADRGSGQVFVLDTDDLAVLGSITVGPDAEDLVVTPDGRRLYVVVQGQDRVAVLDVSEG